MIPNFGLCLERAILANIIAALHLGVEAEYSASYSHLDLHLDTHGDFSKLGSGCRQSRNLESTFRLRLYARVLCLDGKVHLKVSALGDSHHRNVSYKAKPDCHNHPQTCSLHGSATVVVVVVVVLGWPERNRSSSFYHPR